MRRLVTAVCVVIAAICAALAAAAQLPATAAPAGPAAVGPGSYVPVAPQRLLDTRQRIGVPTTTPVPAHGTVTFTAAGSGTPVPLGASAVVLNVTATGATASGYVTAYAADAGTADTGRPGVSTLNFAAGRTVPNLAVVPVTAAGHVTLYNGSAGTVQLLADVSGYYTAGTPPVTAQGAFGSVTPARLLDTRQRIGVTTTTPVAAHKTVSFVAEGLHGVPTGVAAVALNVTATGGAAGGYLTAYASGSTPPGTSNVNFVRGQTVATLAIARTGGDHKVTIYNGSSSTVHVVADVQGYFTAGDPVTAGDLGALPPARVMNATTVAAGQSLSLTLAGRGGVPLTGVSTALLGVTVTRPQHGGYLTVYQGTTKPGVSNLNFAAGQTVANLVAVASSSGVVHFYNGSGGTVQVLADASAYVLAGDLALPPTSAGHYVRSVSAASGHFADPAATGVGCADAENNDTFVLLDIGAQANTKLGVVLSATSTTVTYANLVQDIDAYLSSYYTCAPDGPLTLAIGTNNAGDFTTYTAAARGTDWANKVVDVITARPGLTIEGANDIEGAFASTEAQAQQWETAYLAATPTNLVFNGSADGCPDAYGAPVTTCSFGWTQAQYYALAHNGSRIVALPQVYTYADARKWANIDRVAGKAIAFRGSLTEHAAGCADVCGMTPPQGWAFLYHALSTVVGAPSLPVAADLDVLS